ncbi:beta-galactosidase [Petrimonas sulfuriphila]|jgi:hypothetical protein|uniref:beta-galactosidase n=1 Tax=Petrimonas sulfuriphila TaxID=285070 RepID=UPI003EB71A91
MNRFKKTYLLIVIIALFSSCLYDVVETPENFKVSAPDIATQTKNLNLSSYPKVKDTVDIPVVAWWGIPEKYTSVERFKEAKDAGFNLHFTRYSNADSLQKALDAAHTAGIKLLISCPELLNDTKRTVTRFMNHPANGGYFIWDEPSTSVIPRFKEVVNSIRKVDTAHFCYLNLLPTFTGSLPELSGAETYEIYLNRWITELDLDFISFDHYPILETNTIRFDWYRNLEIIKETALQTKKTFWAFAMATAHLIYPVPDINQLRLQMYSNLAYGAKGIQYFTYWTPSEANFREGAIERDGTRTKTYDIIKKLNDEINSISYIYHTSQVLDVLHYGKNIPDGTKELKMLPAQVKKLNIRGGNALISFLKNNTNSYIMIQNTNLLSDIGVNITFDPGKKTNIILKDGTIIPTSSIAINEEFKIEAGDMVLFMI